MKILLGITGGIAAYKTPDLVRKFVKAGHEVRCVLTENAEKLVSKHSLSIVSNSVCYTSLWSERGDIDHISPARWCDKMLVAPATANVIAKTANGIADDLLTTMILALEEEKELLFAPAMNTVMWNKKAVQRNIETIKSDGVKIIKPISGKLACGETGVGAMESLDRIVEKVLL